LKPVLADRYRIERELGQGGMATVYVALDLKHDRKVAIKVLKPELAAVLGAERFVVEIKTTASLQHPHILPLFDSGSAGGFLYYVMPFIQGETLRSRLDRETQLAVEEAVRIAREVADALDYAHRQGVIHRDIKPENLLLHDGRVLVMDFGIALAVSAAAGGRMTETGLSLGTPHYMSPEQATADKEITPKTDVYSLGSVLYEMLAGEPPHVGGSAQQVIMKILTEPTPPVTVLRKSVPPNVSAAVAKSLEKLPADRFATARDFADALANPAFTTQPTGGVGSGARPGVVGGPRNMVTVAGWAIAAISLAAAGWAWRARSNAPHAPAIPLVLELPDGDPDLLRFAVSNDGTRFAFSLGAGIMVRDAGQRDYRLIPGSEDGESPTFSWDGEWVAFNVRGHLRKAAVRGGSPFAVIAGDSILSGPAQWGPRGEFVFEARGGLYYLPGGATIPRPLLKAVAGQSPRFAPDGRGILYTNEQLGSRVMYYDLAKDTSYVVVDEAVGGQLLPNGMLLYALPAGGLVMARYDAARHAVTGSPEPVVRDLLPQASAAPFFVAANGTLVYRSGLEPVSRLVVRNPAGRFDSLPIAPERFAYARYSPDGRRIALTVGTGRSMGRSVSIFDLTIGSLTRFAADGGPHTPIWSPDGRSIAFTAEGKDTDAEDVFVQPVDRSAASTQVTRLPNDQHSSDWTVDTMLVFSSQYVPGGILGNRAVASHRGGQPNVSIVNPRVPGTPRPYLHAEWLETEVTVSPDGKWAAYTSSESGPAEVMVRAFPSESSGVWKVSNGGGRRPRWSGDGHTIYYQSLDQRAIRAVRVSPGPPFSAAAPVDVVTMPRIGEAWDVDRKSGNILFTQGVADGVAKIVVVQNWLAEFTTNAVASLRTK
jgi:serine/threonine-protein kinase